MALVPQKVSPAGSPSTMHTGCAGFRVDGPDGRIGVVRSIGRASTAAAPERLVVTVGLFVRTTLSIPVADVQSVDAKRRRIVVGAAPPAAPRGAGRPVCSGQESATSGRQR